MKKINILQYKKILTLTGRFAQNKNIKIWVVGGCARDWYLGKKTKDIDLIAEKDYSAVSDFICKKFNGTKKVFDEFGTVRIELKSGLNIDIARTRTEIYKKPACLPKVKFTLIKKDLYRRDFTVNAVAASIMPADFGVVYDPFFALNDIDNGILKILHNESFTDDPTRLFRLCRFAARFNWKPDKFTLRLAEKAIKNRLPSLLSRSRIAREFFCILSEKNPAPAFKLLKQYGMSDYFYPGFKWTGKAAKSKDIFARLGVLAVSMKKEGVEFLRSLNLKREIFLELKTVAELAVKKTASRAPLTKLQKEILKTSFKNLPACALKPLFITGKDLEKAGIKPKTNYSRILNKLARLQWQGKVRNKSVGVKVISTSFHL